MDDLHFYLEWQDYASFGGFFVILSAIGYWAGRGEQKDCDSYFLAGKKLPWYVVGGSYIASSISTEHFIGMIGASYIYGIAVAQWEWANLGAYTFLIFLFIPFLLASRIFTIPEFLEMRFSPSIRFIFAVISLITNVFIFLAAVLYSGGLALHELFGWNLWVSIVVLGVAAGIWAIYGGLSSVAWTDLFTVVVMLAGGLVVTLLGLASLGGEEGSMVDGFATMLECNRAESGVWQQAVEASRPQITDAPTYNRLSVWQPPDHPVASWTGLPLVIVSVSIWYNVLSQFMIQRVLGARSTYDARMGIVLAGFIKAFLPIIIVVPGMILFARHPELMLNQDWGQVVTAADRGYVSMLSELVPIGLRGLFLAALFGAIQSTLNSVLNSTSTIFTFDIYKRLINHQASDHKLVVVGVIASTLTLVLAILLAGLVGLLDMGIFGYVQTLNAFFAPPFAAVFTLGILWRRCNARGALAAIIAGFAVAVSMKIYLFFEPDVPRWLGTFLHQAGITWGVAMLTGIIGSLLTAPPAAEKISDALTFDLRNPLVRTGFGGHWYSSVITWWLIFAATIGSLYLIFSNLVFP